MLRHSPCAVVLPAAPIASCFLPCWRYLVPHCPPLCPFYTTTFISTCLLCYPVLHSAPALYLFLLLTSFLPLSSADLQHAATLRAVLYSLFPSSPASPPHPAIFTGVHSTMACPTLPSSCPSFAPAYPICYPPLCPSPCFALPFTHPLIIPPPSAFLLPSPPSVMSSILLSSLTCSTPSLRLSYPWVWSIAAFPSSCPQP